MPRPDQQVRIRLKALERHLHNESPLIAQVVKSFRSLDAIAYGAGLLERNQSYAFQVPWLPLVSVLGTYSAGKSSFVNHYLGCSLQETGAQAVDDKFTVICYSAEPQTRTLPGNALDSDPRFPFYQMSKELENVAIGEGLRIDSYLQLKTCPSETLKGCIIIDSPGFDADAQRTATLRMIDYIMDLSDLVLVLFDARHPEPGAMRDSLEHLVANTISRSDSNKFLYVLNQIDTAAREDNLEEVMAAWQRAIAQEGLTAGRFYAIYNSDQAPTIEDESARRRFEARRDHDLTEIHSRIQQVRETRAYRVISALERTVHEVEHELLPRVRQYLLRWRRAVVRRCTLTAVLLLAAFVSVSIWAGYWNGLSFDAPWLGWLTQGLNGLWVAIPLALFWFVLVIDQRKRATRSLLRKIRKEKIPEARLRSLELAFLRNTRLRHSLFRRNPVGFGFLARKKLQRLLQDADTFVQELNNRYANPTGSSARKSAWRSSD